MNDEVERLRLRLRTLRRRLRRIERLRQYFSPGVADLIVGDDRDAIRPHRAEVTVVFLDLRGFTSFAQRALPEDVLDLLNAFHAQVGRLVHAAHGTIERFTGDGLMAFFNAPTPVEDGLERAVQMALTAVEEFQALAARWRARGYEIDLGIGIAHGVATVGIIGFEGRRDYGVIGTVTNLAARLCQHARGSQIVAAQPVVGTLGQRLVAEFIGDLPLKGFATPVAAFDVRGLRSVDTDLEAEIAAGVQVGG